MQLQISTATSNRVYIALLDAQPLVAEPVAYSSTLLGLRDSADLIKMAYVVLNVTIAKECMKNRE